MASVLKIGKSQRQFRLGNPSGMATRVREESMLYGFQEEGEDNTG